MENLFLGAIIKFLVDQMGFSFLDFVKDRRSSEQDAEQGNDATAANYKGTESISIRSEYIEAMVGDLFEWHAQMRSEGLSRPRIFVLTALTTVECIICTVRITLQQLWSKESAMQMMVCSFNRKVEPLEDPEDTLPSDEDT